ncbi:MAG: hypothetical protein ACRC8Z_09405, partial [Empedobacter falsenii]
MKKIDLLFFPMSLLALGSLKAQSPGGVTPVAWYKADVGVYSDAGTTAATDNISVQQWNDQMGTGYNLMQATAAQKPTFSNQTKLANFNPTVTFISAGHGTGQGGFMAVDPGNGNAIINRTQGSIYIAGKMNTLGAAGLAGFDATMDFPGLHTNNTAPYDKLLFYSNTGNSNYGTLSSNSFANQNPFVAGSSWVNGAGTPNTNALAKVWLNGSETVYNNRINVAGTENTARIFRIGRDSNWGSHDGQLNEAIVFSNPLSASEKARVDSYLAVKWGSTLTGDYVNSGNTVVWSTSAIYQHNIFGVARDINGALYQKQSRSENPNQQLIIGAGSSLANTNTTNTNPLTDGQFLLVGDNGLEQKLKTSLTYTAGSNGITNFRFESIWKVQNTNSVGTVTVAWPKGINNLYLVQSTDDTFDGSDTFTPMATEVTVNGVVYNTANITLANGQYFTFAGLATNPGGIATFPAVWYKPENVSSTQWIDASINKLDLTSTATGVTTNPGDQQHNFNTWTTGYSATKYYNFFDPSATTAVNNSRVNPVFGNFNNDGVSYMPLSIYGVARATGATNGQITGLDNESNTGHEPGLNANVNGTGLSPNFYRFSNGINQTATSLLAKLNETSIYFAHPYPGDGTATGTDNLILGLNGTEASITGQNKRSSVAGPFLKIGFANGLGFFNGDIQEVIWYKNILNTQERQKVNTYLALKYGTTLSHDYINPDGFSVYNLTVNAGYVSNIAGIVRDDINGAINQKQSNSINSGNQVLISTTGLANSNNANASTLNNEQYLVWGDNGLEKKLKVALSYTAGSNGVINHRFESIWKVQNTNNVGQVTVAWPKGINNLYLVQSTDESFDGTDTFTPMTTEVTVNGVVYNTATVTLANGQYFTFAGYAHAPGGVLNALSYWYRADKNAVNTGVGTDVTSWTDFFSGAVSSQMGTNAFPKYAEGTTNYFNFNPGINFTAINQTLGNVTTQTVTNTSNDIFTVTKEGMTAPGSPNPHFLSIGMDNVNTTISNWDYMGMYPTTNVIERRIVNGGTQMVNSNLLYSSTIPSIMYNTFGNTTLSRGLNGAANAATATYSAVGLALGGHIFGDTRWTGNTSDNGGFIGNLGEAIIYGAGNLTATERRRVDSYLAIKYGITLDRVATDHYLASNAEMVWDGATNAAYNNNIFGIAHDELSALHQKQSKSVNADQKLIIGTGSTLANTNAANTNTLADGQFLLVGDNNLAQSLTTPLTYTGGINGEVTHRFESIWKVQNTGSTGQVIVAWPKGVNNLYLVQSTDETFDGTDIFTPMTTEVTVNGVVYNTANVTLANGQYFTFAGFKPNYCFSGDCNPNAFVNSSDPNTIEYDNIVSIFHSTIVKESNGTFKTWGAQTNSNGTGNLLSPKDITPANGYNYIGTPLKATGGYITAAGLPEQHVLLTTDGLYIWGGINTIISSIIKNTTAFGKISVGGKTDGLPAGVNPKDVKMMFGSYGTLAITTCSGEAWVLSFTGNKNGDGTAQDDTNNVIWHRVKTSASADLTNVVAMRGMHSALFALTSDGKLYTWGTGTYLGDGSSVANRTYATEVSIPSGAIPKMIGMTGGTTSSQSYYLLAKDGKLYSMGDNSARQLGDGTTVNKTNWVQPQKMTDQDGQGLGSLENIAWISPSEHSENGGGQFSAINVLTNDNKQWAWGSNSGRMIGGPADNTYYNPIYMPGRSVAANGLKVTDEIIAIETSGHTSMNVKKGAEQFGYVGHYVYGSMGNGGNGDSGISTYSYSTAAISLCAAEPNPKEGYIYITKKALDENSSVDFNFTVNGGPVTAFTLNDKETNVNVKDLGSSESGRLWAVATNGTLYYRNTGSSDWVQTTVTNAVKVDGGSASDCYFTNASGQVSRYDGVTAPTVIGSPANYGSSNAVDVGSAWNTTPYIITANQTVWMYSGSGTAWTQVGTTTNNVAAIDADPSTGDAFVNDGTLVYRLTSAGVKTSLGAPGYIDDIAVTSAGEVFITSVGYYVRKWNSGTTWNTDETTSRLLAGRITGGHKEQVWSTNPYFAVRGKIYTRTVSGTTVTWLDDERVRTTNKGNTIMIKVPVGTYTIKETATTGWE